MKKVLSVLLTLALLVLCTAVAEIPDFEDIEFPEAMPAGIYMDAKSLDYSYDDMTEKYDIEIVVTGYGAPQNPKDNDPILAWMENAFNVNITWTIVESADLESHLASRITAGDYPDVFTQPSREFAFQLSDQGLLIDAKELYPYMPLQQKYVTQPMLKYSTNQNGELPFITKYGIQDGVWAAAIRADWLETFGMEVPTTKDEILEFAYACTFEDPDGNGIDDTWFMTAAGNGGLGMVQNIFQTMAGNSAATVGEDGVLSHPYFNGVRYEFLSFAKELYDMGVFAPDWYTIDWETAKSYTLNDKIGMVYYPAGALYQEYSAAQGSSALDVIDNWMFIDYPVEGGKYVYAGNPGTLWSFSKANYEGNEGKLLRVLHMLDTMNAGGESYAHTIQNGDTAVYEAFGLTCVGTQEIVYTEDGMFYLDERNKDANGAEQFPFDDNSYGGLRTASWQNYGLNVSWQLSNPNSGIKVDDDYATVVNAAIKQIAGVQRWPNTSLLISLTGEAAEASVTMKDWVNACEYEFVTGTRSLDEYDAFCAEWLAKGGKVIIEQTAACLGCEVPAYAE